MTDNVTGGAAEIDVEIFRAGKHKPMNGAAVEMGEADLDRIASAYDPDAHEAPIVIGHPKTDAPAYGWVKALRRVGDRLVARVHRTPAALREAVRDGRYRKVSASFYRPGATGNPKGEGFYLRHVGFLGAQPPAVKGLAPIELADGDDAVTIELAFAETGDKPKGDDALRQMMRDILAKLRERLAKIVGEDEAAKIIPDALRAALNGDAPLDEDAQASFAETCEALQTTYDERHDAREAHFAEVMAERRRARDEAVIDQVFNEGRFAPGLRAATLEFMATLDDSEAVEFAEVGDPEAKEELTQAERFRQLLKLQPVTIHFGEFAPEDRDHRFAERDDAPNRAARIRAHVEAEAAKGRSLTSSDAARELGYS